MSPADHTQDQRDSQIPSLKKNMLDLKVVSYADLFGDKASPEALKILIKALLEQGIVGIRHVPKFVEKVASFIEAARTFSALDISVKRRYEPDRKAGDVLGFELGAEKYNDQLADDKKASFYVAIPDSDNKWPKEVDIKTSYLDLSQLIIETGKKILQITGLNEKIGLDLDKLTYLGRMLHYHKEGDTHHRNPNWAGAHFDHGIFTGLVPAFYYLNGKLVDEPMEAGLFIKPTSGGEFQKVSAHDKSVLMFQVGEFGQLLSNDGIKATQHTVKKSFSGIERFTLALFFNADDETECQSTSELIHDKRYQNSKDSAGKVKYKNWVAHTYAQFLAPKESKH